MKAIVIVPKYMSYLMLQQTCVHHFILFKKNFFTSRRLEHGLCVLLLPGFHSLPTPEIEMVGDHQGPGRGCGHGVEDGLGHFYSKEDVLTCG